MLQPLKVTKKKRGGGGEGENIVVWMYFQYVEIGIFFHTSAASLSIHPIIALALLVLSLLLTCLSALTSASAASGFGAIPVAVCHLLAAGFAFLAPKYMTSYFVALQHI